MTEPPEQPPNPEAGPPPGPPNPKPADGRSGGMSTGWKVVVGVLFWPVAFSAVAIRGLL